MVLTTKSWERRFVPPGFQFGPLSLLRENELLVMPVEQFLAYLRFEQMGKLDQIGIEIGSKIA